MYPAEESISGLIAFDTSEARIVMQSRCASDDTLQATLASLAQDRMHQIADAEIDSADGDWEVTELAADFEALEHELLAVYLRLKSR
jgi:hypothetical protein